MFEYSFANSLVNVVVEAVENFIKWLFLWVTAVEQWTTTPEWVRSAYSSFPVKQWLWSGFQEILWALLSESYLDLPELNLTSNLFDNSHFLITFQTKDAKNRKCFVISYSTLASSVEKPVVAVVGTKLDETMFLWSFESFAPPVYWLIMIVNKPYLQWTN